MVTVKIVSMASRRDLDPEELEILGIYRQLGYIDLDIEALDEALDRSLSPSPEPQVTQEH
jgi:hypothetical protein